MRRFKKIAIAALSLICVLCAVFAFGCSDNATYYTVTFMDGQTQVGESIQVKKGGKIPEYPTAVRDDPDDVFDGWFKDDGLTMAWNHDIERVTKDITLWANFLHVSAIPNNVAMTDTAFSNTVSWLQRGITAESNFVVKISGTDIVSGGKEEFTFENYKGYADILTVKWTPTVKPLGGTYSVEITDDNAAKVTVDNLIFKGAGEERNPYLLYSQTDLTAVNTVDVADGYYKLAQSFTAKNSSGAVDGKTFNGKLDGNGKAITLEASDFGLFGILGTNSEVKDLTVAGAVGNVQSNCVGAIAGVNRGEISYCTVSVTMDSAVGAVGELSGDRDGIKGGIAGIAGINYGKISCCAYSTGTIKANVGGAGIAVINNGEISLCSFTGTIGAANAVEEGNSTKAYSYIGGIVSINYATVEKSSIDGSGKILAQRGEGGLNDYVGGIAALNKTGATIKECRFDGIRVHGNKNVGGIAGANAGTVTHCYAGGGYHSGSKNHSYVGGLSEVGGIVGLSDGGTVTNCFVTSNVYAYSGDAYKVAQNAVNSVYVGDNLDGKSGTVTVKADENNGNIKIDASGDFSNKNYPLVLTDEQLASLNGGVEAFVNKSDVRLACEDEVTVIEHFIAVYVSGSEIGKVSSVTGNKISLKNYTPTEVPANHYFAGWAIADGGEKVFDENAQVNYAALANYGEERVTLYPVFIEGEKPQPTVVYVAVYKRYILNESYAIDLVAKFREANGYSAEQVILDFLGESDTSAADFGVLVNAGKYDIVLACGNNINTTCGVSVNDKKQVTVKGQSGRYIAILTDTNMAQAFYEFVETPAGKKALNPDYVTEDEAQKIEITLMSNGTQYGEKLTVSDATDAVKATLPEVEDIPAGYLSFLGWATTEAEAENETLLTGKIGYDDLKDLAANGALTLYARFTEEEQAEIVLRVAVYNRYITEQDYARDLIAEFVSANGLEAEQIVLDFLGDNKTNASAFGTFVNEGTYDIVLACGNNIDSATGCNVAIVEKKGITVKEQSGRYIAILTETETAQSFYSFVETDAGKKALNPDYISQAEAKTIEITLMNGDTQYGEKLTVSNATEAVAVTLPASESENFAGWAVTETAVENEKLLTGDIGYEDLKELATDNALTLYARFNAVSGNEKPSINVAVYKKFISNDVAVALETAFKAYCEQNDIQYESITVTLMTTGNGAAFTKDAEDCDVALGHKGGTSFTAKETENVTMWYTESGTEKEGDRKAERLTDNSLAVKFMEFLKTDDGKAALLTGKPAA